MQQFGDAIRAMERAGIESARRMTFEERCLAGADLFKFACSVARDGIRMQHPRASHEEVEAVLEARLARVRWAGRGRRGKDIDAHEGE